jgi:hypothetical protein
LTIFKFGLCCIAGIIQNAKRRSMSAVMFFKLVNLILKSPNLKLKTLSGESFTNEEPKYEEFSNLVEIIIEQYGIENVLMLMTVLFFKNIPSKTLATTSRKGFKKLKDRVLVLLGCYITGSVKKTASDWKTKKNSVF